MINVYDFDGTIYNGDSSVDFYLFCLKNKPLIIIYLPIQIFAIILYKLKFKDKEYMKSKYFIFLKRFNNVEQYVSKFWDKNYNKVKKWYLLRKKKSDIIISASPEFLLSCLKEKLGIYKIIGSKVNPRNGKFESKNCYGNEKIRRYELETKSKNNIKEFYTDSIKSDRPLILYSKNSYLVKKDIIIKIEKDKV